MDSSSTRENSNPIYRTDVPLDCFIICDILGIFLRHESHQTQVMLPSFRLAQMCDCVGSISDNDGNLLEAIGSLYALCMYVSFVASNSEIQRDLMAKALNVIQICACESMSNLAVTGAIDLEHPLERVRSLRIPSSADGFQFYTFVKAFDAAKGILRDAMKQVRKARDEVDRRTYMKQKFVSDFLQSHSIYFMCTFALSHSAALGMDTSTQHPQVFNFPGVLEVLVIAVMAVERVEKKNDLQLEVERYIQPQSSNIYKIEKDSSDPSRFQSCMVLASELAFSVFDRMAISHVKAALAFKMSLVRNSSNTADNFARMQVVAYEHLAKDGEHDITARHDISLNSLQANKTRKEINYAELILLAGRDNWSRFESDDGSATSSSIQDTYQVKNSKKTKTRKSKDQIIFEKIHPRLRELYKILVPFTLDSQQSKKGTRIIPPSYSAQFRKLSPHTAAVELMTESFTQSKLDGCIPRTLNSSEGQFWCSQFLFDLAISKDTTGSFLCRHGDSQISYLRNDLHLIKGAKIIPGTFTELVSKSNELEIVKTELSTKSKKPASRENSSIPLFRDTRPTTPNRLSLYDKLKLASAEAKVQSNLLDEEKRSSRTHSLKKNTSSSLEDPSFAIIRTVSSSSSRQPKVSKIWNLTPPPEKNHSLSGYQSSSTSMYNISLPLEISKSYASKFHKLKLEKANLEQKMREEAEMLQEIEVGKTRTSKLLEMRKSLEIRRLDQEESAHIKVSLDEERRKNEVLGKSEKKDKKKILQSRKEKEIFRANQLREQEEWLIKRNEMDRKEREEFERVRLRDMADRDEFNEIIRRNEEEARMKVLEERQRVAESKVKAFEDSKVNALHEKQKLFADKRDLNTSKYRKGIFKWRRGKYSFYPDARQHEVPWIQYEDDSGVPYYYDSVSNKTQYKEPNDATIITANDVAIEEYEAVHGAGSYAVELAERAFKDECNANGGYYDDRGKWITMRGYYDENYDYVDMSHGYYNDEGEFILHPPVSGDLDFMV